MVKVVPDSEGDVLGNVKSTLEESGFGERNFNSRVSDPTFIKKIND